jgi:hypothetical protein
MRRLLRTIRLLLLTVSACVFSLAQAGSASPAAGPRQDDLALKSFAAIHPIDAHVHVFKTDPAFQAMLERLNLKLLNILVMDDTLPYRKELRPQVEDAQTLVYSSRGHVALCTTFDPYKSDSQTFAADAIKQIDQNFAEGAVAVKIWKNIGMEIKDGNGRFIMADDPRFDPVYKDIAARGKTLLSHQAEPDVAWGPPDPSDPTWSYYKENPQWYVGDTAGFPSKQTILDARDHVLANNPNLRMVGVHLGSMEKDLDNIAKHLDKYPNFAIDTAARMEYLMMVPPEKARAFLIKYQDRIIYGTDLDFLASASIPDTLKDWQSTYRRDWRFLATSDIFSSYGRQIHGLNLPRPVLQKILRNNAIRWIPGL